MALLVPVLAFAILTLTFSNAVVRNLRVAIVDADRSATSLVYVQSIASAPGVTVAERSSDMKSAMQAVRAGDAIAAVYIPENFERDLLARKRPQVVSLYNRQYYTPGNNAASAISNAISAATAALPHEAEGGYKPGILVAEQYVLSNPALNFAQFLLRAVLPTVLHVVTAIAGGYAVGSEFSQRSKRAWMRAAGGRPLVALVGKFLPLFAIFLVMMLVDAAIIHVLYGVNFRGDPLLVAASACLLLIGYLSFGALLVLLTQSLPTGLSLIALFCNPAFGFAGVGFPAVAMGAFPQAWGSILPLRWYLQILFDQAARGLPASNSVRPFMILAGLACLYFAMAWARLRAIANAPLKREETPVIRLRYGRGVAIAMSNEVQRILGDRGVLGLIVLAPLAYGALYPQPYLGQVLRGIPIAVVDQDQTELSRNLVQALNADEAIAVKVRSDTIADAQSALDRHEVFAILAIPKDTERQVLRGEKARIAAYVDAAYFLLYSRTLQGISEAAATVSADIATRGARREGSLVYAAMTRSSFANRVPLAAFVQPDRRLRQLCRARRLHPHPSTDTAARRRVARRGGLRARRAGKPLASIRGARGLRPGACASLLRVAGACALSDRAAARLWLLDPGTARRSHPDGGSLRALRQLPRPVRERLVSPPRDRDSRLHRRQPAALLPGRRILAGRSPS